MDAKERARQVAAENFYGKGTTNLGCCSAACKNCEYGGKEYECQLCILAQAIAAAIEQAVSEALKPLRRLSAQSTPGEWSVSRFTLDGHLQIEPRICTMWGGTNNSNAAFIVAAVNLIREQLALRAKAGERSGR